MGRAACFFRSRYHISRLQLDHVTVSSVECHAPKTGAAGKRRAQKSIKAVYCRGDIFRRFNRIRRIRIDKRYAVELRSIAAIL